MKDMPDVINAVLRTSEDRSKIENKLQPKPYMASLGGSYQDCKFSPVRITVVQLHRKVQHSQQ